MNVPNELKEYKQWVCWKAVEKENGKITKVPYSPKTGTMASVTNPKHWSDFNTALSASAWGYSGIGFVLTKDDPFVCIDLDPTDNPVISDRQKDIFKQFNSFSELSPSGKGLHIWLKGSLPSGKREPGIEIYPSERYITITGDVYHDTPIREVNGELTALWEGVGSKVSTEKQENPPVVTPNPKSVLTDDVVISMATNASNGQKFTACYNGQWESLGYPSGSESDFALIDMLFFYTKDKEQVARIFKASPAGQREKYRTSKNDYHLNRMLDRCNETAPPQVDLSEFYKNILNNQQSEDENVDYFEPTMKISDYAKKVDSYFPPGMVGEIAQYIYDSSPRPVKQIALTAAFGLMAGVCGRAYNTNTRTGLNLYLMLIAETGRGKEGMKSGISSLTNACTQLVPSAKEFEGPGEIASKQALIKYLGASRTKSFVSIFGEIGIFLQKLSHTNPNANDLGLKSILLDLYGKSGHGNNLGKMIYSDQTKSTDNVDAPAFTLIGESTPTEFYRGLTERSVSSGLLPRCIVIEYRGDRPRLNKNSGNIKPPESLVLSLADMMQQCLMVNEKDKVIIVNHDEAGADMLDKFDIACDDKMNKSPEGDMSVHLWNRAHLKALRLSSLIAVGLNPHNPVVNEQAASYAIDFVMKEVNNILTRFDEGSIGAEDQLSMHFNLDAVMRVVDSWYSMSMGQVYNRVGGKDSCYKKAGMIPYRYIQSRIGKTVRTDLVKKTLEDMVNAGYIVKCGPMEKSNLEIKNPTLGKFFADAYVATPDFFEAMKRKKARES